MARSRSGKLDRKTCRDQPMRMMSSRLIGLNKIIRRSGLSREEIEVFIKKGKFPSKIIVNEQLSGWSEDEIQDWILLQLEKQKKDRS